MYCESLKRSWESPAARHEGEDAHDGDNHAALNPLKNQPRLEDSDASNLDLLASLAAAGGLLSTGDGDEDALEETSIHAAGAIMEMAGSSYRNQIGDQSRGRPVEEPAGGGYATQPMCHFYPQLIEQQTITTVTRYQCGYCGAIKPSNSVGSDGRVRIRCKCGGKHRDGKPRMHAMWSTIQQEIKEPSPKRVCTNWQQIPPSGPYAPFTTSCY
eukprot:TRINITY_DN1451_c0_g2_i1.p1 TRINITY_DN1451_c0_g2~~TRINITY_DN1451_c0_g2_i1.p1  ORF type:complete len:213 (-),score=31.11 TRINITY_DN1451_c0_g2_i1:504-1142(-)